jgi:hypothetical protein
MAVVRVEGRPQRRDAVEVRQLPAGRGCASATAAGQRKRKRDAGCDGEARHGQAVAPVFCSSSGDHDPLRARLFIFARCRYAAWPAGALSGWPSQAASAGA